MLDFNQWFMRSHFCTRQITNFSDKLEYLCPCYIVMDPVFIVPK